MIDLILPYPPTINHYYGQARSGRRFIKERGKEYREITRSKFIDKYPDHKIWEGKVSIRIYVYPPDKRKRDLDNLNKCLWDSLEYADVFKDDSQIYHLEMTKFEMQKGGWIRTILEGE